MRFERKRVLCQMLLVVVFGDEVVDVEFTSASLVSHRTELSCDRSLLKG